ncbi:DUF3343 domain-containing protein [Candidatus Solincola tengchongensis]|uniref:DUF3343 domain-containing protein n=1 Tax=Candidatus Solincola tengchongensis TaxID=2900693 RepID=UPI00257EE4F2|nr:DUF3343 domain-containing protein [Candidatus Solincola tengchongensis]
MNEFECRVILFDSTHQALRGERALKEAEISYAVINTPREFSVDCGISLRIGTEAEEAARAALQEAGVVFADIVPYRTRVGKRGGP